MRMMKYVIYFGVLFMPDGNAAAQRAYSFSKLIKANGYTPVIIGMNKHNIEKDIIKTRHEENGMQVYEMNYPNSILTWLNMLCSIKPIVEVIENLGGSNVQAVIAMDYFSIALKRIIRYCKENNIKFVADAVDWFSKSLYKFPKGIIKDLDTKYRMEFLYKKIDCMITISDFLKCYYQPYVNNIIEIPGIYCKKNHLIKKGCEYVPNDILTLGFVGSPGKFCEKEKIDWIIQAICKINYKDIKIKLIIAGVDQESLQKYRPDLVELDKFEDSVICKGRIAHTECVRIISKCDFTIIVREDNLLSKAGFPTKLGESFAYGTPVFATPTSNIAEFISSDYGFVTDECTFASVENALYSLLSYSVEDKERMHATILKSNPLDWSRFVKRMQEVLENE